MTIVFVFIYILLKNTVLGILITVIAVKVSFFKIKGNDSWFCMFILPLNKSIHFNWGSYPTWWSSIDATWESE